MFEKRDPSVYGVFRHPENREKPKKALRRSSWNKVAAPQSSNSGLRKIIEIIFPKSR
jgi:hypothetical protein